MHEYEKDVCVCVCVRARLQDLNSPQPYRDRRSPTESGRLMEPDVWLRHANPLWAPDRDAGESPQQDGTSKGPLQSLMTAIGAKERERGA